MRKELTSLSTLALLLLCWQANAGAAPGASRDKAQAGPTVLLLEGVSPIPSLGREVIAAAADADQLVQSSGLGLEDLQIAVGCADRSVACLQAIGKSIKAGAILLVSAHGQPSGGQAGVTMRLFVVKSGVDRARSTVMLPLDAVARKEVLGRAVRRVFAAPEAERKPIKPTGTLIVKSVQPYVELEIDGQPRGTPPLELTELPAGRYRVVARLPGHLPFRSTAVIQAGRTTSIQIDLVPTVGARTRRAGSPPGFVDSVRTPTWIIAGVGLASLATAAIFGAHMVSQQNAFDDLTGDSLEDVREMQDLRDTGERDAVAANVLFGVGGAALVVAAILAYVDYREADAAYQRSIAPGPSSRPAPSRRPAPPTTMPKKAASLLVGPTAIQLRIRF